MNPNPEPDPGPEKGRRPPVRRLATVAGLAALLAVAAFWVVLWVPASARWVAERAISGPFVEGSVRAEVGSARLWRLGSLSLDDVQLIRADGSVLASVDTVEAAYRLPPLLRRTVVVPALRLVRPMVDMRRDEGAWEVSSLMPKGSAGGPPWTIETGHLAIDNGTARITTNGEEVSRVRNLMVRTSDLVSGDLLSVDVDSVSFTASSREVPGLAEVRFEGSVDANRFTLDTLSLVSPSSRASASGTLQLSGGNDDGLGRPERVDLRVEAPHVLLGDLGFLGANLNPSAALAVTATVETTAPGQVDASARIDLMDGARVELDATLLGREGSEVASENESPPVWREADLTASMEVAGLNPSYVVTDGPGGALQASGQVDLELITRGDSISTTSASGDIDVEIRDSFLGDLRLEPGHLNLALDGSTATFKYRGAVSSSAEFAAPGTPLRADVQTQGTVRRVDGLQYDGDAELSVSGLSPEQLTVLAELEGEGANPETLTGALHVRVPRQPAFGRALEADLTYEADSGAGPWSFALAHGTGSVDGDGRIALGDTPALSVSRLVADSLNLGTWVRDTLPSHISGRADGELRGTSLPDLNGRLDVAVSSSTLRGRSLGSASAALRFESGTIRVQAGSTDTAPVWALAATARPFDTPPTVTLQRGELRDLDLSALGEQSAGTINGSLSGILRGFDPATATGHLELQLDSSQVASQPLTGGRASFGLAGGVVDGRFLISYPTGEVEGEAQASLSGGNWSAMEISDVSFRGLDLARLSPSAVQASTSLNGELERVVVRNFATSPVADLALRLSESTVNDGGIESGRLTARLSAGRLSADGSVSLVGGGVADMTLSASVDSFSVSDGEARVRFDLPRLGALLGVSSPASIRGQLDIESSDAATGSWTFSGSVLEGTWENLTLDTAVVAGQASRRVIEIDTLSATGNAFQVNGGGLLVLDATVADTPTFTLSAELTDALPLAPFIDAQVFEVGTATANLRFGRTQDAVLFEGQLDADAILIDELRIVGLDGDWFVSGTRPQEIDSAQVSLEIGRVSGPLAVDVASTDLEMRYDGDRLIVEAATGIDEARDGDLRAIVDPTSRGRRFEVERFRFSIDEDVWLLDDRLDVDLSDGISVTQASLVAGDQRIAFGGGIHPSEPDSFNLRTENFRVGTVSDLLGFPDVEATLSSEMALTGSLSDPQWSFDAEGDLQRRGQDRGSVDMALSYGSDRLATEVTLRDRTNHSVSLSGFVPVDMDFSDPEKVVREAPGEADLLVHADSFDIQWFAPFMDPAVVSGLGGIVSIDASIRGQTRDPLLSGRAHLSRGSLSLPRLGTAYSQVNATVRLDGRTIAVEEASLSDGEGEAQLSGTLALESLGLGRFDIAASLDEFLVISNRTTRARTAGQVRLRGTTDAPRIEGSVEVVSADMYLSGQTASTGGRQLEEVELTEEDLATLRELFGYRPPETEGDVSALVNAMSANLDIVVGRDSWLRQRMNPELAVQLSGELTVEKEAGSDPRVLGTISPVAGRSYVEQWGKRFEMRSGEIVFRGPPLQPDVQLSAQYEIPSRDNPGASEVLIQLDVEGRPDSLRLILSSTPSMDNADIVSYIATGRPAAQSLSGSEGTPM